MMFYGLCDKDTDMDLLNLEPQSSIFGQQVAKQK